MQILSIGDFEQLIRSADFAKAREKLRPLLFADAPRAQLATLANFANRVGRPYWALRFLRPVFGEANPNVAPRPAENMEYANALRRWGCPAEALEVLARVEEKDIPAVLLQRANCHSTMWNYTAAAPLLREFIKRTPAANYVAKVARINLLSALIHIRAEDEYRAVKDELEEMLSPESASLLTGNFYELQSQWLILQGAYDEAISILERARPLLAKASGTWDAVQVEKGLAVARSLKSGRVLPDLLAARERARESGQWEVFRDSDRYIARLNSDSELFSQLYFGSESAFYREFILAEIPRGLPLAKEFLWPNSGASRIFDLQLGRLDHTDLGLKPGHQLHRLLMVLASDHYKTFSLLRLHSRLAPGTYFDPFHTPDRLHQTIRRFRQWSEVNNIPVSIEAQPGGFRLLVNGPDFAIRMLGPVAEENADTPALQLLRARSALSDEFTSEHLSAVLGHSLTSSRRLLRWGIEQGSLVMRKRGAQRVYRFA